MRISEVFAEGSKIYREAWAARRNVGEVYPDYIEVRGMKPDLGSMRKPQLRLPNMYFPFELKDGVACHLKAFRLTAEDATAADWQEWTGLEWD